MKVREIADVDHAVFNVCYNRGGFTYKITHVYPPTTDFDQLQTVDGVCVTDECMRLKVRVHIYDDEFFLTNKTQDDAKYEEVIDGFGAAMLAAIKKGNIKFGQ